MSTKKRPKSALDALMDELVDADFSGIDILIDDEQPVRTPVQPTQSMANSIDKISAKQSDTTPNTSPEQSRNTRVGAHFESPAPYKVNCNNADGELIRIHWNQIQPWALADRPEGEFGDMDEFVHDVKLNGQHTPIIVRKLPNALLVDDGAAFEFIVGNRRWNACKVLDTEVLCLVRELNDEQAFAIMHSENDDREDISPWAKGVSFSKAIDSGAFKSARALAAKLGKNYNYVSDLLVYSRIPKEVAAAIGAMSKVSQNTAKVICQLSTESKANNDLLIALAPRIASGLAKTSLIKELQKLNGTFIEEVVTLKGKGGSYCTLRADSNGTPVFSLLKDARSYTDNERFQQDLVKLIDRYYEETIQNTK